MQSPTGEPRRAMKNRRSETRAQGPFLEGGWAGYPSYTTRSPDGSMGLGAVRPEPHCAIRAEPTKNVPTALPESWLITPKPD